MKIPLNEIDGIRNRENEEEASLGGLGFYYEGRKQRREVVVPRASCAWIRFGFISFKGAIYKYVLMFYIYSLMSLQRHYIPLTNTKKLKKIYIHLCSLVPYKISKAPIGSIRPYFQCFFATIGTWHTTTEFFFFFQTTLNVRCLNIEFVLNVPFWPPHFWIWPSSSLLSNTI